MFDWHVDGRLRDEAVSHEYDHCVLRYAMNVQPRIAETLPPKAADVLIGIHVRSSASEEPRLRRVDDETASLASEWDDHYHLDVAWKMADFARFAEGRATVRAPGRPLVEVVRPERFAVVVGAPAARGATGSLPGPRTWCPS